MGNLRTHISKTDLHTAYEMDQRRKTLRVILWAIFFGGIPIGAVDFAFGFINAGMTLILLCVATLVAIWLNERGNYDAAAAIISSLLFFVLVYDIVDAGGLGNDLGMMAFPFMILAWGLFLGKRGLTIFTNLSTIAVGIISFLDLQKVIYVPRVPTGWGDLVTTLVILGLTAVFSWVILDNAENNLEKLKSDDTGVRDSYELTLEGLVKTLELRDQETEHHSRRVVALSLMLAKALGLSDEDRLNIRRGALLHDIGKLGVPDHILLKEGPLNPEEWTEMRRHPEHARAILAAIPFLQPSICIPYYHHERWDGAGYPRGLKGEEIPYYARLFAIVDQWEALTSDRIYRKAWSREKALAYIRENIGKVYDPAIGAEFLELIDRIEADPASDAALPDGRPGQLSLPQNPAQTPIGWLLQKMKDLSAGIDQDTPFDLVQRRQTLNVILWVTSIACLGLGGINFYNSGATPDVWVIFALSLFCLVAIFFNKKRYFFPGAIVVSLLTLAAGSVDVLSRGGLHDMGIVSFPVTLAVCGLFFGKRGLTAFTLLSMVITSSIGLLEITRLFNPIPATSNMRDEISLVIFILVVSVLLRSLLGQAENARLRIKQKEAELRRSYDLTLEGFARAFEFRGREPEGHTQRVVELSLRLAKAIGLQDNELETVRRGALLHDIGTLFIPDRIMLKPGPLNAEEWAVMKKHPERARDLLANIPYLETCLAIPYSHHEYWDGSGYPQGLKGEDIPLPARLFTLVDHWEELSCDRPFRSAWPPEKVLAHIRDNAGRLYDPRLTTYFIEMMASGVKEGWRLDPTPGAEPDLVLTDPVAARI